MSLEHCIARLEANIDVFRGLLSNVGTEQARWKPSPDKWSLLEVLNHVADEEVDDFRTRLRLVIENPSQDWPPIDPPRWAVERRYNERELSESLDRFLRARQDSLDWLWSLPKIDWQIAKEHPRAGTLHAGDLLHSWLAHDMIHIRQMYRLHFEYLLAHKDGFAVGYAGDW